MGGGGLDMCGVYGNTVFSSQLRCQPKTALKTVYLKGKKKKGTYICEHFPNTAENSHKTVKYMHLLDCILGHELVFVFLIFLSLRILFL